MKMKTAITHDVFIEFGGAERVFLELVSMYSDADIFIPLLSEKYENLIRKKSSGKIFTSLLNRIPFVSSASVLLKPFLYLYFENIDLSTYDLVISSSHSFSSKSVITGPNTLHISYVHTPPRYLYAEYNETRFLKNPIFKILLAPLMSWLRTKDFIGGQRPDVLIANSKTVQKRIKKYYRRESEVIYPPVKSMNSLRITQSEKKYFLCFSRLAKQKGIDLAIKACNELQLPLVVVGRGSEDRYLKAIAGPTITFLGFVPDIQMPNIFVGARALINCALEEDFGMVNVEALSCGVPIIGFNSGGIAEIVNSARIGRLFSEYSVSALSEVLKNFEKYKFSSKECRDQSKKYSTKLFREKLLNLIQNN